jgi:O-antigen ligase
MVLGVGLVALAGWVFGSGLPAPPIVAAIVPMLLLIGYEIVATGSRGGFASLMGGMTILSLRFGAFKEMVVRIGLASVLTLIILFMAMKSDYFVSRWTSSIEGGNFSKRDTLAQITWDLFLERPLLGWGPADIRRQIGRHVGKSNYDAHNLYLYVLGETGLLGAIIYLSGLGLCVRAAWRARRGPLGPVPLALVTMVLLNNMSDTWQFRKLHWLVLAFALASELVRGEGSERRSNSAPLRVCSNGEPPSAGGPEMNGRPLRRTGG